MFWGVNLTTKLNWRLYAEKLTTKAKKRQHFQKQYTVLVSGHKNMTLSESLVRSKLIWEQEIYFWLQMLKEGGEVDQHHLHWRQGQPTPPELKGKVDQHHLHWRWWGQPTPLALKAVRSTNTTCTEGSAVDQHHLHWRQGGRPTPPALKAVRSTNTTCVTGVVRVSWKTEGGWYTLCWTRHGGYGGEWGRQREAGILCVELDMVGMDWHTQNSTDKRKLWKRRQAEGSGLLCVELDEVGVHRWLPRLYWHHAGGACGGWSLHRLGVGQGEWQFYRQVSANTIIARLCKQLLHRSLQTVIALVFTNTIIAQVSANSYCRSLYKHNHCAGLCKQLLHRSLQTQSLCRSLQTITVPGPGPCRLVKRHPWWLTSDHWLPTSQRRSCTAAKSLVPGLSDTEFSTSPTPHSLSYVNSLTLKVWLWTAL